MVRPSDITLRGARVAMGGPTPSGLARSSRTALWAFLPAVVIGWVAAAHPELLRLLCAIAIGVPLLALALSRPVLCVRATFVFLVVLALVRRLLIADAGWSQFDPMLLVGPLVVVGLLVRLFLMDGRPLATDRLSVLVLVVLGMAAIETLNPGGGGPLAGFGGFLFVGIPLLWFFIGRELTSPQLTRRLLVLLVGLGVAASLYGLVQVQLGFPSWDVAWLNVNGYVSLHVGNEIRGFGPFSSSAEYALFVGSAMAVAFAMALEGRLLAAFAIPPLAVALFFSSSRGALVTAFLAIVIVLALRTRRPALAAAVAVLALGGSFVALKVLAPTLSSDANSTGNSLVSHQLGGISDPLNPDQSTLLTHLDLVRGGVTAGIQNPLGSGTGATNQAGSKLSGGSGPSQPTEVDISNAFVGLGLVGGLAYLAVVLMTLTRAVRGYFAGVPFMLPIVAVLVTGLGQWLIGGHYALSPLTWLLIGAVAASTAVPRRREQAPA